MVGFLMTEREMKSYEERLPLIDAAIDELKGEFPPTTIGYSGRGYYAKGDMANILHKINFGDVCTREEFEQRKAERQNKPSWSDAPEWANWLTQGVSGVWYWWTDKPIAKGSFWVPGVGDNDHPCSQMDRASRGEVIGNWQDTLEQRPETKEQDMNNDWYEKGDPEVGQRLFYLGGNEEREAIVLGVYKDESDDTVIWHKPVDGLYKGGKCFSVDSLCFFRPLRTERDALVEKAEMDIHQKNNDIVARHHIQTLIDAGWRPTKQQSEDEFVSELYQLKSDGDETPNMGRFMYRAGCRFIEQVKV